MLYPQYKDPLHIVWRKGDETDPYEPCNEEHKIVNNIIILGEIPDQLSEIVVNNRQYSQITKGSPLVNQFIVDYNKGIITFNSSEESKTVTVDYQGRGIISYPAERIYLHTDGELSLAKNLQQVLDSANSGIEALTQMDSKIAEVDTAVSNASIATNEANTARDNANTSASNADSKAVYADTQGSYALTQGDYAKVQGDYAKSEGDYAKDQGDHAKSSIANSVFFGDYVGATAYKANNTVRYNNALYRCIQDSQNNLPTNSVYWVQELSIETEVADAQQAATEANTARDNANTSASNADTKAAYAQTQGDYAKTQGDYASDKVIEINTKITEANTATTNANTARDDANTSASNADTKAAYAQTQGDYAKTQGDYAKLEGDYAQSQGDLAKNSIANYVFLGEYAGATVYKVNNTVRYNNALYRCIQDSQNNLPTDSLYWIQQLSVATELADAQQATIDANTARDNAIASASNADTKAIHAQTQGDFAQSQGNYALGVASEVRHLGDYNLSTSYVVNNSVSYNGSSYICIADCTGITPTNTSKWALLAQKGYDGVGNVDSVNGYGGNVVLNATDVGAIDVAEKGVNSGVATLDSNGKIPLNQIPDISKQQTYIVANSTERSSLSGMITGDKSYETTTGDSYIFDGTSWVLWADADWANVNIDWGNITNTPSTYAPSSHNHSVSEISDFDPATKADKDGTLQNSLNAEMVGGKHASDFTAAAHASNISNPHSVTVEQIGASPLSHSHNIQDFSYNQIEFYVDGDADTYYPVVIDNISDYQSDGQPSRKYIEIFRAYHWEAPATWNTETHKGSLQLYIDTYAYGWGGQTYYLDLKMAQLYSKTMADIRIPEPDTDLIIVWLRGGHARYSLLAYDRNVTITPFLGDFTHRAGTAYERTFSPLATVESAFNYADGDFRSFSTIDKQYIGGSYRDPKNGGLIWTSVNDGTGSGLDADLLDGKHASDFTLASHSTNINNPHGVTTLQIGAETPTGAQTKADTAEANAKSYTNLSVDNNVALRKDGDGFAIINGSTRTTLGAKSIDLSYTTSGTTGAIGNYSYTEGEDTTASGSHSSARGQGTKSTGKHQNVEGKFNVEDTRDEYAHIIGNGVNDTNRGNAVAIDWNGNIFGGLGRMKFAQIQIDPPIVEYRRQDDTLYLRKTASNPDGNEFYQTVTEEYFLSNGSTLLKTITFTLTFNEDGTIATSDGGVEAYV